MLPASLPSLPTVVWHLQCLVVGQGSHSTWHLAWLQGCWRVFLHLAWKAVLVCTAAQFIFLLPSLCLLKALCGLHFPGSWAFGREQAGGDTCWEEEVPVLPA